MSCMSCENTKLLQDQDALWLQEPYRPDVANDVAAFLSPPLFDLVTVGQRLEKDVVMSDADRGGRKGVKWT